MRQLFMIAIINAMIPTIATAQKVRVTVENLQPTNGFYFTPVWAGFHDGGFNVFDSGAAASASLKALAEEGDVTGVQADFAAHGSGIDGILAGPSGFGSSGMQPPVLDPGESSTIILNVDRANRYFSFATMVIPSNDGFFSNDDAMGIEVFDAAGQFSFVGPITLGLSELWDAGTELNDGLGAAFSANGGTDTTESNPIGLHDGLINFDGTGTAAGTTISFVNASASPVLRLNVSLVPEPNGLAMCLVVAAAGLVRRSKRRSPTA